MDGTTFTCDYDTVDAPTQAVGAPPVPTTTTFTVTSLGISEMHETYPGRSFTNINDPFDSWLRGNHPDVEGAGFGEWTTVEEAVEHGGIRIQYAREWAAWLDELGCEVIQGLDDGRDSIRC